MPAKRAPRRPLGLKAEFEVSPAVLETLAFIEQYDLEGTNPTKRVLDRGRTLEFKRFLALPVLYPGRREVEFVPSLPLDALWHSFILNTPRYRAFCERAYGQYLDHTPGKSRKETEIKIFAGPMQYTVEKVMGAFDDVNKRFWQKLAYCGPCLAFKKK
jgi:hypothetical protein